jgi:hypothetical protein
MHRPKKSSLAISLVGAAAAAALALAMEPPAKAACIRSSDPNLAQGSNCTNFDSLSPSFAIVAFQDSNFLAATNLRQIRFRAEGFDLSSYPITLSNIAYSFDSGNTWLTTGLTTSYTLTDNDDTNFGPDLLTTDQTNVDLENFRLTFTIPAGNLSPLGAGIVALVAVNGDPPNTITQRQERISILADPVPGPLPILGAGVAFGFSRRLRRRIRQAA